MTTPAKPDVLALAQRAKELAEKATPGPWRVNKYGSIGTGEFGAHLIVMQAEPLYGPDGNSGQTAANSQLAAFAREALPLLASSVETLTRELAEAKAKEADNIVACIRSTTWSGSEEIVEMIKRRHRK